MYHKKKWLHILMDILLCLIIKFKKNVLPRDKTFTLGNVYAPILMVTRWDAYRMIEFLNVSHYELFSQGFQKHFMFFILKSREATIQILKNCPP